MRTFSITTLGCKVNQYESARLAEVLSSRGMIRAPRPPADLLVVNTCCVTATAMAKCRQAIRRQARRNADAAVLVAGCYSDYDSQTIASALADAGVAPGRWAICGHHNNDVADALAALMDGHVAAAPPALHGPGTLKQRRLEALAQPAAHDAGFITHFEGHQRAFVKVQDGCDAFCSYCVVPYTRPRVSWRPADAVVAECRGLLAAGYREVVLSGVFLGAYGRPTAIRRRWAAGDNPLASLLRRVAGIEGLWRVRLSSLEPLDVNDDLLATYRELPTVAPHLHLPLQSGSDAVLHRMNRQYSADDFRRTVDRLRDALDRPAITTDIIAGFPGESDDDFAATLAAARHAGFAKIHAFPFSPIRPTAGWAMRKDRPAHAVVRRRMEELTALDRQLGGEYRRQFVGQTVEALVEGGAAVATAGGGRALGAGAISVLRSSRSAPCSPRQAITDRYLTVLLDDCPAAPGTVIRARIENVVADGVRGVFVGQACRPV